MGITRRNLIKTSIIAPTACLIPSNSKLLGDISSLDDCGVASGSPTETGFVIWTRLPDGVASESGRTEVKYELSLSPDFSGSSIVSSGVAYTDKNSDYTLHVKLTDLDSDTTYYYRFVCDQYQSVIGRARTVPDQNSQLSSLSFAIVCCQKYSDGYYTALAALNQEDVHYCIHLGDHIYEKETGSIRNDDPLAGQECMTLDQYRIKYRHYLSDPNYRRARQQFTWIDVPDDHEIFNDYAGSRDRAAQKNRVAAAYQAFAEYMPIEGKCYTNEAGQPSIDLIQSLRFGPLVEFFKMDQRQFRKPNPCSSSFFTARCSEAEAPDHSMLGTEQSNWLKSSLANSSAKWRLLLSEVMFSPLKIKLFDASRINQNQLRSLLKHDSFLANHVDSTGTFINLDGWDGYPAERESILQFIAQESIANVVALTGDIHAAANAKLFRDGQRNGSKPVAYEIVTASLTSSSLGDRLGSLVGSLAARAINRSNPHIEWSDIYGHGYAIITASLSELTARHVVVSTISRPTSTASIARRVTLRDGFNL
jgi:alkaline phosphatase D